MASAQIADLVIFSIFVQNSLILIPYFADMAAHPLDNAAHQALTRSKGLVDIEFNVEQG